MTIDFSCPRCGTQFKVNSQLAGKRGRCKKCAHQMKIPAEPPAASVVASGMFQLSRVERAESPSPATAPRPEEVKLAPRPSKPKSVKLKLVSDDVRQQASTAKKEPAAVSDPASYKLTPLTTNLAAAKVRHEQTKPPSQLQSYYWKQLRKIFGVLRNANDFAYLISIAFFLLLLVAIVLRQRNLAVMGATGVILVNIGRLAINGFYVLIVPFKIGIKQGILFLIPPFTFYYLVKYWARMKQAALRLAGPAIAILAVVLVFVFVPWLSSGDAERASIRERIRGEAGVLKEEIKGQLNEGAQAVQKAAEDERLRGVSDRARSGVEAVKNTVEETIGQTKGQD